MAGELKECVCVCAGGGGGSLLTLHCHHLNDLTVNQPMCSRSSCSVVRCKVTRLCPQSHQNVTTKSPDCDHKVTMQTVSTKSSDCVNTSRPFVGGDRRPKQNQTKVVLLTSLAPYRWAKPAYG